MDKQSLQNQLLDLLRQGRQVSVRWNCGGDEAFVYTLLDGVELSSMDANYTQWADLADSLESYLIHQLDLPSVGEFSLKGEGQLAEQNGQIVLTYQTVSTWQMDYDQEHEKAIYSEPEEASGREILFQGRPTPLA